ncbi:MAG: hypothetical protein GY928_19130, partial [Colwellia sp.]|nr:hypothetical protein [Colwellia sp.]
LLSIKADNEEKLDSALPAIKTHFWSLGMNDVKKAFEMYADGQLSTKPRSNHIDRILVGQIFNDYKMSQRQNSRPTAEFDKETQDFLYCVTAFDYFQQNGALPEQAVWLYEYLTQHKGIFGVSDERFNESYNIALDKYENKDMATLKSKLWLVEHYFSTLLAKDKHIKDEL